MPSLIHDKKNNSPRIALVPNDPIGPPGEGAPGAVEDPGPLGVFAEGQILDDTYRVVRVIGEGGMGVVYEAAHARLSGRYAIKALIHKLSDDPDAMARFDREARITSSLQHPNIVQVIDFNRHTDGTEYLVMEYLQGETLGERLRRVGALPTNVVVGIVEQIAAALAAAHSHGVVHRDLKPENIFLIPVEGRNVELAKVLDFGISKISDHHRGFQRPESALMGTPEYMSPEQFAGRPGTVDAASDQFALAAITYQMLTGRTPFSGDSLGDVMARVLHENPPPMGIDPTVERVVCHGLAKSKLQRFPSVTAFADALRAAGIVSQSPNRGMPAPEQPGREITRGDAGTANRFDDQEVVRLRPRRNRVPLLLVVAALSVGVFFVVGSSGVESMLMPRWSTPTTSDEGEVSRPVEVHPAEVRPAEVRPLEIRPAEVRPEVRPMEVQPEVQPIPAAPDTQPAGKAPVAKRAAASARSTSAGSTRARVTSPSRVPVPRWTAPPPVPRWTAPPPVARWTTPPPVESSRPITRRPPPLDVDATLPLDESLLGAP